MNEDGGSAWQLAVLRVGNLEDRMASACGLSVKTKNLKKHCICNSKATICLKKLASMVLLVLFSSPTAKNCFITCANNMEMSPS